MSGAPTMKMARAKKIAPGWPDRVPQGDSPSQRWKRRVLKDATPRTPELDEAFARLLEAVEQVTGVTWKQLAGSGRHPAVVMARRVVREIAVNDLHMSNREAAHRLRKSHSAFSDMQKKPIDEDLLDEVEKYL